MDIERKTPKGDTQWNFIYVNEYEALSIIKSLTSQILNNSSNAGRLETMTKQDEWLTIAVYKEEKND